MRRALIIFLAIISFQTDCKKDNHLAFTDLQDYDGKEIKIKEGCILQMSKKVLLLDASSPIYDNKQVPILFPGYSATNAGNSILKESIITNKLNDIEHYSIQPRFCIIVNSEKVIKTIRTILVEYTKFYKSSIENELYVWNGEGSLDLEAKFAIETSEYSIDIYINTYGKNSSGILKNDYPLEGDESPYEPGTPVKIIFDLSI